MDLRHLIQKDAVTDQIVAAIAGRRGALIPVGNTKHWNKIHMAILARNLSYGIVEFLPDRCILFSNYDENRMITGSW